MKQLKRNITWTFGLLLLCNTVVAWEIPSYRMQEWETGDYALYDIETLTDGSVWATHDLGDTGGSEAILIKIDPVTGVVSPFIAPGSSSGTSLIRVLDRAPNDTLWIADKLGHRLLNFNPAPDFTGTDEERFTSYDLHEKFGLEPKPYGVSVAPDGKVWFTCPGDHSIGMFDPKVTGGGEEAWERYLIPNDDVGNPVRIAIDDTRVWFTIGGTGGAAGLGKLTLGPSGNYDDYDFTFFVDPAFFDYPESYDSPVNPHGITVVAGVVWFIDGKTFPDGTLVRFVDDDTSPHGTGFSLTGHIDPHNLAADPDGVIWFTAAMSGTIGAFHYDPLGVLHRTELKTITGSFPMGIAIHPTERKVWFTEPRDYKVGRIIPARTAKWLPSITVEGDYAVYARWRGDPENTSEAPYTVTTLGSSHGITIDQREDGSQWQYLITMHFSPEENNSVDLSDSLTGRVVADAIGLDSDGDETPDIIVDDGDSGFFMYSGGSCFSGIPDVYDNDFCYFGDIQDFEHDGIHDSLDTVPFNDSDQFDSEVVAGTIQRGDQDITVSPAPFTDGVRIEASCSGGQNPAIITYELFCPDVPDHQMTAPLSACKDISLECGNSAIFRVLVGPVEFDIGEGILVTVPSRAEVTISEALDGILYILNSGSQGTIYVSYGGMIQELSAGLSLVVVEVTVDVKPGSTTNPVNINKQPVITVGILTTETFDATEVDPMSVRFGPSGATEIHEKGHVEDVDDDGDFDLVLHFDTQETGIEHGDTEVGLAGETYDGRKIVGSDAITMVGGGK